MRLGFLCDTQPSPDAKFIPADELPYLYLIQVLHVTASLALRHGIKYVVVGWHSDLGNGASGVKLCSDGCFDGMHGTYTVLTDLAYIEAQANMHPFTDEHALVIKRRDGRSAVVIRGDENTVRHW
jgi:hypothetical protein